MDLSPDILRSSNSWNLVPPTAKKSSPFSVSQMLILPSTCSYQTRISLSLINWTSSKQVLLAGVWKDVLQRPVEVSQILTTPSKSYVVVVPSFVCRVMELISAAVRDMDPKTIIAGSVDGVLICQNLTDLSSNWQCSRYR